MFSKPYTDGPQFKQLSFNGVYILLEFDNINQVTLQIWFCWSPNVFKTLFLLLKLSPYYKYQTKEKYVNLYVSINCIKNKNIQYWTSMILDLRSSSFSLVVCTPTDCKYITHIPQWKITVFVSFSSFWVSEGEQ